MASRSHASIFFGGPDLSPNRLRDVLINSIEAVPVGGEIRWICYYLNDPHIIQALVRAAKRDVSIHLSIDKHPRTPSINHSVTSLLNDLDNVHLYPFSSKPPWYYLGIRWLPHLHSKLYYFSHPKPHTIIGSYNPTASLEDTNAETCDLIGDHSISHNVLVDINQADIVDTLVTYLKRFQPYKQCQFLRLSTFNNTAHKSEEWEINFLPRSKTHPMDTLLNKPDKNASIKCAVSHLKGPSALSVLKRAIAQKKSIEFLIEKNERRVDKKITSFIKNMHIPCVQLDLPEYCLMHNKFIIYKSDEEHSVMFGSFNWSTRSRWLNHEIIAKTTNKTVVSCFESRWNNMIKAS